MKTSDKVTPMNSAGLQMLREDLQAAFRTFPRACLGHLRENFHRLKPGAFQSPANRGCVFYLLSELLPAKIASRESLAGHFQDDYRKSGEQMPPRLLVRAYDGYRWEDSTDDAARARYQGAVLDNALLMEELDIALRTDEEEQPAADTPARNPVWDFKLAVG